MIRLVIAVSILAAAVGPRAAAQTELYVAEVNEEGGPKPLKMRVEEIERAPRFSILRVTHTSGASVPSSMFVARALWEIARLRKTEFFINLKEWDGPDGTRLYKVGYSDSDKVDVPEYFGETPDNPMFMSVHLFAPVFDRPTPRP
jgi:hypothetical protein